MICLGMISIRRQISQSSQSDFPATSGAGQSSVQCQTGWPNAEGSAVSRKYRTKRPPSPASRINANKTSVFSVRPMPGAGKLSRATAWNFLSRIRRRRGLIRCRQMGRNAGRAPGTICCRRWAAARRLFAIPVPIFSGINLRRIPRPASALARIHWPRSSNSRSSPFWGGVPTSSPSWCSAICGILNRNSSRTTAEPWSTLIGMSLRSGVPR